MKAYRLVVIDYPISMFDNPFVSSLLGKVLKIKFETYGQVHAPGVIPADKADFFGTHLILCEEQGGLNPIFAYRSVTLERCLQHRFEFPALTVARQDGSQGLLERIESLTEKYQPQGHKISWDSAWAQDASVRVSKTAEERELFRRITMAIGCLHHQNEGIDHMLTLGTLKVKTDVLFNLMGLAPVLPDAKFSYSGQFGSEVEVYGGDSFSLAAKSAAEEFRGLWSNRLAFSGMQQTKKVA
jgi:hypothetical protein